MAHLSATVPDEHLHKLHAHARANDRTLAAEARRMLRMYLQVIEQPRPSVESVIESSSELARAPITAT